MDITSPKILSLQLPMYPTIMEKTSANVNTLIAKGIFCRFDIK